MDPLSSGANATTIVVNVIAILGWIATGFVAALGVGSLVFRKTRRMSKNLARPFAIIASSDDKMTYEKRLLDETKFFKPIDLFDGDHRAAGFIDAKYRLVVLRFEEADHFWSNYEKLQADHIPVIIYAKPGEIKNPDDIKRIQKYTRHTLCNTPVRLLSDVWAIMSTYPEGEVK